MLRRTKPARGPARAKFTAVFGPPAVSPVPTLLSAFGALLAVIFPPVRSTRLATSNPNFPHQWIASG